jgi:hypothetical protein
MNMNIGENFDKGTIFIITGICQARILNSKLTRNSKKSWLAEAPVINRQDGMFGKGRNKIDAVVN